MYNNQNFSTSCLENLKKIMLSLFFYAATYNLLNASEAPTTATVLYTPFLSIDENFYPHPFNFTTFWGLDIENPLFKFKLSENNKIFKLILELLIKAKKDKKSFFLDKVRFKMIYKNIIILIDINGKISYSSQNKTEFLQLSEYNFQYLDILLSDLIKTIKRKNWYKFRNKDKIEIVFY